MEGKERPTRDISPCLEFALERKLCARPTQSREGSGQAEGNSPKMSWGNPSYKDAAGHRQGCWGLRRRLAERVWSRGLEKPGAKLRWQRELGCAGQREAGAPSVHGSGLCRAVLPPPPTLSGPRSAHCGGGATTAEQSLLGCTGPIHPC